MDPIKEDRQQPQDPATSVQPPSSAAPVADQWQTKDEYKNTQAAHATETASRSPLDKPFKVVTIIFALSAIFFVLCLATPLGRLIAIEPGAAMSRPTGAAYPLVALSLALLAVSFVIYAVMGVIRSRATKRKSWPYITLIIGGALLFANPIGAFILLFMVMCNLSPCEGT